MASGYTAPTGRGKSPLMDKKLAINDCLKQFRDVSDAFNEVCKLTALFGRSLQSVEDLVVPDVIGSGLLSIPPKKYNAGDHLANSLDTINK